MGFLTRQMNGNEPDQGDSLEEQYKNLVPKIGRDFVAREDLEEFLQALLLLVDPLGLNPIGLNDSHAKELAQRYRRLVEKGKDGGESKRDLIPPEED